MHRRPWILLAIASCVVAVLGGCGFALALLGVSLDDPDYEEAVALDWTYLDGLTVRQSTRDQRSAVGPTSLASFTPSAAFRGNQSAVAGGSLRGRGVPTGAILVREANCSLTQYGVGNLNGALSTITATLPNADAYLHRINGLTTTGGAFPRGCADRVKGVPSAPGVYLGQAGNGDLLSATADSNGKVTALRTNTLGVVVTQTTLIAGNAAATIAAADLNGDGIADIVTPYVTSGGVTGIGVFLSRPDGTFAPLVVYAGYPANASRFRSSLVIEDVDGDGRLDLVGLSQPFDQSTPPTVVALLGAGNGLFAAGPTGSLAVDTGPFVLADFDGDGRVDLLTSGGLFAHGNGNGAFATPVQRLGGFTSGFSSNLAVGDFDNDGRLDVARRNGTVITLYLGVGDGSFRSGPSYAGIRGADYLNAVDVDGDGNVDLVVGLTGPRVYGPNLLSQAVIQILMGRGDGSFVAAQSIPGVGTSLLAGAPTFALADFNGDTFPDLVAPSTSGAATLELQAGSSAATFGTGTVVATLSFRPMLVTAGDVDADGRPDLVVAGSRLAVLKGTGNGLFAAEQSYALPVSDGSLVNLAVADFNGDGRADVVVLMGAQNASSGGAWVYLANADGTLKPPVQVDNATNLHAVAVGDLNQDGRADLAVGGLDPQFYASANVLRGVRVYRGNADGSFTAPLALTVGIANVALAIGDLNKDGRNDLVVASQNASLNDSLSIFPGRGDGSFGSPTLFALPGGGPGIAAIAIGDFTFDGNADVMLAAGSYSAVAVGAGDGTISGLSALTIASRGAYVVAADLNGDTIVDAVVAQGTEGLVPLVRVRSALAATAASPTFSFTLGPGSGTVASGQSAQTTLTLSFTSGFTQTVSFACANLPANARCTFGPSAVAPGATPTTVLTIATGVASATAGLSGGAAAGSGMAFIGLGSIGLLGSVVGRRRRRGLRARGPSRRHAPRLPALLSCALVAVGLISCGGSDNGSANGQAGMVGAIVTPRGTYPVTVTATAGSLVRTAVYTLTVN